ncbi:TonB-dependent receptor [Sphingobium sp. SCG-1]|uniref:TonB-dependent receptor n=1 Tax=Sphingobium sp. SCG-1 TaxID=2072936 RepID=UPI001CB9CE72|nr:TonB-dependent receptor [Sphingobium sp. SCG-1]
MNVERSRLTSDASGRLEDILKDVAGFQQFRRTDSRAANPTSQGATLRALGGNASSRALVLLDGVPLADPFTGYIPFSSIDPSGLASVRVTRGGGAGPFGAGAVAGTIELESGGPVSLPAIRASSSIGSRDSSSLAAGSLVHLGQGFLVLTGGWDRGDGYTLIPAAQRGPADVSAHYDSWRFGLRAVASVAPGLELQTSGSTFGDHRLRGLAGTNSKSRGTDASVRLVGNGRWPFEILAYIQERDFASGFVSINADRSVAIKTLDQYATPSTGLGGKIEIRPTLDANHLLRIGADVHSASGATHEFFRFQAGTPTALRRAGGLVQNYGVYAEDHWKLGALTLTGGARVDRWQIHNGSLVERAIPGGNTTQVVDFANRSGTRPTARAAALLALSPNLSVRTAGYIGFRIPTLNELYRPFRVGADATAANADLKLERLKGLEGGATLKLDPVARLDVTIFWNRLENAVSNATLGVGPGQFPQVGFVGAGGTFRQRMNVDAIVVRGVEVGASTTAGPLRLNASYAFSDAVVRASGLTAALDHKRPAQSPRHQASATLAWIPHVDPLISATLRYTSSQFEDDLETRKLPDALTVDAVASLPLARGVHLVLRGENLFGVKVVSGVSATGVEDLGTPRTIWVGFRVAR